MIPIGMVCEDSLAVNRSAHRKSFHASRADMMAVAMRPGFTVGRMTAKNAHSLEHPSIIAASSSSRGTADMKPCMRKVAKGMLKVV